MAGTLLLILFGLVLVFFGRSLYWLFVAIAGFLMGMELAADLLTDQPGWVQFLAALAGGVLGAMVGILAQRIAFAAGGFFAGGYLALSLLNHFPEAANSNLLFIVGGIIGAIIAALLLDWAIIVISSLAGAAAVTSGVAGLLEVPPSLQALGVLVIAVLGVVVQGRRLLGGQRAVTTPPV